MSTCFQLPPRATRPLLTSHYGVRAFGNHHSNLIYTLLLSATQSHPTCGASPLCLHKSCQPSAYPRIRCGSATCNNGENVRRACVADEAWIDTLVVVEGLRDQRAVRKAVSAQVE